MGREARPVGVVGAHGALGRSTAAALEALGATPVPVGRAERDPPPVVAVAAPWGAVDTLPPTTAAVGAALRPQPPSPAQSAARVPVAGWFGGLGTLLAARATLAAGPPAEVHVAYALLPGLVRAWSSLSPGLRAATVELLVDEPGTARVDGAEVAEPVGEGRRLAWFPRPVGPWHTVAVPSPEAAVLTAPTVRTWLGFGSLGAELLQAVAHGGAAGLVGSRLGARARAGGSAAAPDLRWAVVAEVRTQDGTVHRGWANGTDPVRVAGELLAQSALRAGDAPAARCVLDLDAPGSLLDGLADRGVLRWSVARPQPAGP